MMCPGFVPAERSLCEGPRPDSAAACTVACSFCCGECIVCLDAAACLCAVVRWVWSGAACQLLSSALAAAEPRLKRLCCAAVAHLQQPELNCVLVGPSVKIHVCVTAASCAGTCMPSQVGGMLGCALNVVALGCTCPEAATLVELIVGLGCVFELSGTTSACCALPALFMSTGVPPRFLLCGVLQSLHR